MDERLYYFLKYTAILIAVAGVSWSLYDSFVIRPERGDYAYHAGSNYFADGHYDKALAEYNTALDQNPQHIPAKRGRAETLIMLEREREAIAIYDQLITLQPSNAGHYANRGIAYDRLGDHEQALANYEIGLSLDLEVGKGPNWLTRFLRNQPQRPPGIADRAGYLRTQLMLPPEQRLLRIPAEDAVQRPYKK